MIKIKPVIFLLSFIFIAGGFEAKAVLASSAPAIPAAAGTNSCDFGPLFNQLDAAVNSTSSDYTVRLLSELKARQDLLGYVLDCGITDVDNLKQELSGESVPGSDIATQSLKSQYLGQLNQATDFYNNEKSRISGLGILGTKQMAAEVLDWKESVYNPQSERITDFILWLRSQRFVGVAQGRLDGVGNYLKAWNLTDNPDIQSSFGDAQNYLRSAQSTNLQIQNYFNSPNPGLSIPDLTQLVKNSLESVSGAYQSLLSIQDDIKKILP